MDAAAAPPVEDTPFDAATLYAQELPDACMVLSPDGRVEHWSRGAHATFGYDSSEAIGRSVHELVVPPDRVAEQRKALADTVGARSVTFESVRRRKDGSMLCVDVTTKLLAGAGRPLILMSEKDVTDIKVQRDAKLMEARFRDLLESTPDGIVMANPTGHIVIANGQAESLFGYGPGELRGKPVDILLPERYRRSHVVHRSNYFLQPRKRAMGSGLDLAGVRKDGTEFPIEISLSPLRTEETSFVMSAIRDISERKRFERALQEKNVELAAANQAKDKFLASMSHELRTPLNAIIGFTGTLLMGLPGPLTPDQYKQLRTVQTSARHLLALINDLLDVAKIEAGKVDLAMAPVDCCAVIDEVVATLRNQAEGKGLQLAAVLPAAPLLWTTDRRALSQIVLNLAGNAVKFTDSGSVTVTLGGTPEALQVTVDDTGVGIPAEEQAKLFVPFSQAGSMRPRAAEGTGLGLHLSQRLAELLGGRITFESTPGQGSRFVLRLLSAPA
ncbi:MAG: PAS domain S-box protein [Rhizobacter sp.]|nr:PAS domain S-box protein [Rhizobacter sp.]